MTTAAAAVGWIRPELAHLAVPIGQVTRFPGNPRRGDRDRIRTSLTKHGQYKPLLVQASTGFVVAGNNTLETMAELGWTHVAVLKLEIDDDRARHLLLIDNRSSDRADYDQVELVEALSMVTDWDASGWESIDLDALLGELVATGQVDLSELAEETTTAVGPPPAAVVPAPSVAGVTPSPPAVSPVSPATATAVSPPPATPPAAARAPGPAAAPLLSEWTLLYPRDDRAEAVRLVNAIRSWLGPDLTPADVVLRALRALAVVGDARHDPHATVRFSQLLLAAGHNPLEDML